MSGLEKALFNLKFTTKQLNRQAAKAGKDETAEKAKLEKVCALHDTHIHDSH
jgi:charged multivesicular body protein 1